ncbi:MAG: hypothetical protein KGS72_28365, partial [Cyanobacteria bacterium REEB67]|nr:hypothetical protein [Cyanobacteria bacterium REEB67]
PEARAAAPEAGPKASLSNLFDSGVLNSRYGQEAPKKPLGFGNLLAGSGPAPTDDSHTAFADLMVPTGEHDALLAPDRHQDSGPSAFDEISAQLDADANYADHAPGENGNAFDLTESYNSEPDNAAGTAFRADEKAQPPAFSSLFSNEIVTSGQDFSNKWLSPEPTGLAPESNLDSDLLEPEASPYAAAENSSDSSLHGYLSDFQAEAVSGTGDTEVETVEESYNQSPKSLAISKLLEAVNQKDEPASSLFSSEIVGASSDAAVIDQSESATPAESHPPVTAKVEEDQATLESWLAENIGGAESGVNGSEAAKTEASSAKSEADAEAARNAAALEALAAFAPKQGEEQHETKGLLKKLKAKEQAEKAARRAEAEAKTGGTGEADAPVKSEAEPVKKSSLSSLLSSASDAPAGAETPAVVPSAVNKPAPVAKSAPREEAADDDDSSSGNSLGDAISNALDKLLGDDEAGSLSGAEPAKSVQAVEAVIEEKAESEAPASSKFLDDDPDRFNRPINSPRGAEKLLEDAVVASVSEPEAEVPAAESHPLTLTNSKVDALSRLLEVASKAPEKSGDDKNKPGDSANKLAQMINKPPGKISRQVETIDGPDYTQPKQEAFTSPFGGGTSPFASPGASYSGPGQKSPTATSPFGTPVNSSNSSVSLNHTPAGGFSPTGQSQSQQQIQSQAQSQGSFPGSGSMTDMPKASGIASDAVSARIAALNRKLEEQTRAPGASGSVSAMPSPGPSLAPPMDIMPPPMTAPPAMAPPAPDFVANPIVDGSPQTRAELVNRILGSAKISQTIPGEMPVRPPSDSTQGQLQAQKFQKNSPPKSKARAHGGRGGLDPKPFIIVFVVIAALCAGGYFAIQNGIINPKFVKGFDLGKGKSSETKLTIDQVIKSGDTAKAIEMLEAKKESGKFSSSEGEKLNGLYYSTAEKAYSNDDDPAEAMKLLEKIPPKTKKFKDAQKLLRKFKKKVKKN